MAHLPDGTLIGAIAFDTEDIIGAGGWVTRLNAADDGTMVCGSDAAGPRIRKASERKWRKLSRPGVNRPITDIQPEHGAQSTWDVAICATNSLIAYWVTGFCLHKTTDGGATASVTSLVDISHADANEGTRMTGRQLAVDPVNGNVVFIFTPLGLKYSIDGGALFTSVSTGTIPAPSVDVNGNYSRACVAFDRTSAVVGGKTQGIYLTVCKASGSCLYHSTNGGSTWTNIAGGPSVAGHMRVSPIDGYVHLAGDGTNGGTAVQYMRWNGSTWLAPTGVTGKSIAVSPHYAGHIYMANDGSWLSVSTDNGATWSGSMGPGRKAIDIPWHEWCNEGYMSNGDIDFDGSRNRLWLGEGIGAWYIDNPPTTNVGTVTWLEASAGIENMVGNIMNCDPNGRLLYSCHDRRGFAIDRVDIGKKYPPIHAHGPGTSISHGGSICSAPDNPDVLYMPIWLEPGGKSIDGGKSWFTMPGNIREGDPLSHAGGNIVALSADVIIQRNTANGKIFWSKDGGATFTKLNPGGVDLANYNSHHFYWTAHRPLAVDIYVPNQAFIYLVGTGNGDAEDLSYRGIWKINYDPVAQTMSTTRVKGPASPYIESFGIDYWHGRLIQLGLDDWLWCAGDASIGLWRSTDGCANWSQLTGTDDVHGGTVPFCEVYGVAVGAGRTEASPKTIIAIGFRASPQAVGHATWDDYGLWMSEDTGATWVRITQAIAGCTTASQDVAADPQVFGLFYVALGQSEGVTRYRYQDKRALS